MASRRLSPRDRLRIALESLLLTKAVHLDAALESDIPRSWEIRGDLILLPNEAFRCRQWETIMSDLWEAICSCFGVCRVARQGAVKSDDFRSPQVEILKGDSGWVKHKENGITYWYDVTKCMFSSGNITEKLWIGNLDCRDEVVVDMFAGIGYFTLPYLVHAKAKHVHACEWNPDAVTALKLSLAANQVANQCTVHEGDNKEVEWSFWNLQCRQVCLVILLKVAPKGVADRVNLGLIPSSEDSWKAACRCLKAETGGWLHIHGNINLRSKGAEKPDPNSAKERWLFYVVDSIKRILSDSTSTMSKLTVQGYSPRKVKSYGPYIWHMVADIQCHPVLTS